MIINFFKRLFCRHKYVKYSGHNGQGNIIPLQDRYKRYYYTCVDCHKLIIVNKKLKK